MSLIDWLHKFSARKIDERRLKRWGGIQTCTWCRQTANQGDNWGFKGWDRDAFLDVLTCGCCGGTSLWKWEIGMLYIGPLDPPKPARPAVSHYDVAAARFRNPAEGEKG